MIAMGHWTVGTSLPGRPSEYLVHKISTRMFESNYFKAIITKKR
jgi:hypothetical protein